MPGSEGAIAQIRRVDSPDRALWNDLERDQLELDTALVSDHVNVAASYINHGFPCLNDPRRAGGIVALIERRRARFDRHQTGSRVRMPAGVSAQRDCVGHDIDI